MSEVVPSGSRACQECVLRLDARSCDEGCSYGVVVDKVSEEVVRFVSPEQIKKLSDELD